MPSPMETLFRIQASPVPTQTILEFEGSIATAPIDCTSGRSNTGLERGAAVDRFPDAAAGGAANTVSRPLSLTAVTAAMRPLIVGRTDVARRQAGDRGRIELNGLLRRNRNGKEE